MAGCVDGHAGLTRATEDEAMTDQPVDRSLLEAIEQGRGQRGGRSPQTWSRSRAQLLTAVHRGLSLVRIGGEFGLSPAHVGALCEEACDAVLRGGGASEAADSVCARRWQGWCARDDTEACDRLRRS